MKERTNERLRNQVASLRKKVVSLLGLNRLLKAENYILARKIAELQDELLQRDLRDFIYKEDTSILDQM